MLPSGSQSGVPDTAPDPVRTAVAQAANTVRYRRDLRQSHEVLEAMSKDELILVNTALRACSTQLAATLDPAQLIEKIRAYLTADEQRDNTQLRLANRLEQTRNQLLLAPEAPDTPMGEETSTALLCRSRHSVPPSQFLRALSDDHRSSLFQIEMIVPTFIPEDSPLRTRLSQAFSEMHEVHTCMLFYHSITDWTHPVAHPSSSAPADRAQAATETGTGSDAPRSYRDAARQSMTTAHSSTQPTTTPAQKQRIAQARELRKKTQEIKAQIRYDERSFQLCPVTLKGDRPSFRQLGISLERTLKITNLKEHIEDIRSDHGGRYYVQIRADLLKSFEKALDRCLEGGGDSWDLELTDIGTFTVNNPYLSPTKDKVPVVISNVDVDIDPEAAITAIAEQNASRWKIPATELEESHFAALHRLNRRKRDSSGQPLPE